MTRLVVGSATDVGMVRSNNQDQYLVAGGLYAVADGMGGHAAGEVASLTAIEALRAAFDRDQHHTADSLVNAAKTANRAVWDQARANRGMLGMGTTLVALAVVEDDDAANAMAIAHIGDSRAYVFRDGALSQLTTDHSLVQELVDDGQITEDEATVHPQRHVLTRALGVEPAVEVDLLRLAPRHGDRYLLCSDGLPREASADQIAAVLSRFSDPSEAAKELVSLANAKGGSDNVTVVVVDVLANDPAGESMPVEPGVEPRPASSTSPGGLPLPPVGNGHTEGGAGTGAATATGAPLSSPGRPGSPRGGPGGEQGRHHRGGSHHRTGRPAPRWVTLRVVLFVVVSFAVVGGAIAGLAWYARSTYYVTISGGHITVFQGRPGGVLWFQPTVAERTKYTTKSVLAFRVDELEAGQLEPSVPAANSYIARLVSDKLAAEKASRPPAASTTTTRPKRGRKNPTSTTALSRTTTTVVPTTTTTVAPTTRATTTTAPKP